MKNKTIYIIGGVVIAVIVLIVATRNTGAPQTTVPVANNNQGVTQGGSSDPQDIVPGTYKNEINNTSTEAGLVIVSGLVENNVDSNNKAVDDHLELVLKNSSQKDMSDFEVYYTVTDTITQKNEGYYKKLISFILKAGETQSVHFDNKSGLNHFGVNTNAMYFTSVNELQFDVEVSTPGFKTANIQIKKDAGGAEVKD